MLPELFSDLDTSLFRFLNEGLRNPVFDIVMPFLTDLHRQRIALAAAAIWVLWILFRGSAKSRFAVGAFALTMLISDQLSSRVLKYLIERPRPCHVLAHVHLLVGCGSGYSFPSSHAVNHFAAALVLSWFYPKAAPWLFLYATLIAFSRVYVGVHYPSDVLGGAVIGAILGVCIAAAVTWSERFFPANAGGGRS